MPHEVIMPALGMTQDSGVIVAWRKAKGDPVAIGDPLFDVETDKATMEVEAAHAGTLTEIRASAGADIPVGQTIAVINEVLGEVPTGTRVAPGPQAAELSETKSPTPPITPISPKSPAPPALPKKPAAPSTLSITSTAPIFASPKARFEAHRRGIDLRRLVDQGIAQPFHVADLDRLSPEPVATSVPPAASELSAKLDLQALENFALWAREKTGKQDMRKRTLAAFAAAAFRSGDNSSLTVSVLSARAKASKTTFRDPDLHGLGELADETADHNDTSADLTLVDFTGTRLTGYRPAARRGGPTIVLTQDAENDAVAILYFCEDDLSLFAAASFLNSFAERVEEPATQLL